MIHMANDNNQGNNSSNNSQNANNQQPNTQPQQQGNVIRPQQANAVNNQVKQPVQTQPTPQANPQQNAPATQPAQKKAAKPQSKNKEDQMCPYEKRFRTFVKNRFGGMIGEILLGSEFNKYNVNDFSLLEAKQQIEIMEKVIVDVFKEHNMQEALEQTKVDLKFQLAIDKMIELMKPLYASTEVEYINVTHNNSELLNRYNSETEKALCTFGDISGQFNGKVYLFTSERETMMLVTDYAKKKNIDFNPLDEKQKNDTMFGFFNYIRDSFITSLKDIIPVNITNNWTEIKPTNIELVDEIKKQIDEQTKTKGSRVDVVTAEFTITLERQDLPVKLFICV